MNEKTYIPWVEKYRPTEFDLIVLSEENQIIFSNMFKQNYMPNLLLYGPPGTGKTTTIINLIREFQLRNNELNKGLMIHLNASDERGIDIIRNQINSFVNSKSLFNKGVKFIILDEVDYMTKNAQQALKYLLQEYRVNVRFCLICNYISKIDESLQNELMKLRFNQLPREKIKLFLQNINKNENLYLTDEQLDAILLNYKSDVRSMINYMQSNQLAIENTKVIDNSLFIELDKLISINNLSKFKNYLYNLSTNYNIDSKTIVKDYCNYYIQENKEKITENALKQISNIIHNTEINPDYESEFIFYSLLALKE
tara:strand:+ start:2543 stop:3478 length:936 start_codon:yes stop_codon:yes gene_type:complete